MAGRPWSCLRGWPVFAVALVLTPMVSFAPGPPGVGAVAPMTEVGDQYVRESGHCTFSPQEVSSAAGELRRWRQTGQRAPPGAVP